MRAGSAHGCARSHGLGAGIAARLARTWQRRALWRAAIDASPAEVAPKQNIDLPMSYVSRMCGLGAASESCPRSQRMEAPRKDDRVALGALRGLGRPTEVRMTVAMQSALVARSLAACPMRLVWAPHTRCPSFGMERDSVASMHAAGPSSSCRRTAAREPERMSCLLPEPNASRGVSIWKRDPSPEFTSPARCRQAMRCN